MVAISGGVMKKSKILVSLVALVIFSLLLFFSFYGIKSYINNKKEDKFSSSEQKKKQKEENIETIEEIEEKSYFNEEVTDDVEPSVDMYIYDIVNQAIEDQENSIKNENKLKNTFILLTDFIFYEGEIKGKTFNELKEEEKAVVIGCWERLDSYIERKYPNYKEKIKDTSTKQYSKIKEKASELKEKVNNLIKERIGEEAYNNTIDQFYEDKENLNNTIEPYKEASKEALEKAKEKYQGAKEKLSDWYQNYKNSN